MPDLDIHVPARRSLAEVFNAEQMGHVLRRERGRCDRSHSQMSLVVLRLQDLTSARDLQKLAYRVMKLVRETDEIGYLNDHTLGVVLPDTDPIGASIFVSRIKQVTHGRAWDPTCVVYAYPEPPVDSSNDDDNHRPPTGGPRQSNRTSSSPDDSGMPLDTSDLFAGPNAQPLTDPLANAHPSKSQPKLNGNSDHSIDSKSSDVSVSIEHYARSTGRDATYADDPPIAAVTIKPLNDLFRQPLPWWKRALDIAVSGSAIIALSPIMAAAALAIRLDSPGPVVFRQQRAGIAGRPFTIFKFRTMCVDAEAKQRALKKFSEQDGPAFKIKNDPRITRIGRFLRKTSIDELPQLFNILNGTMTLVGPRPLPMHEAEACRGWHAARHDVTPGLTCIWQVHGRSRVKFEEWMRMDMRYARKRSLWRDLKLVLSTVPAVLLRRGAN